MAPVASWKRPILDPDSGLVVEAQTAEEVLQPHHYPPITVWGRLETAFP
jgi:hypothetical protein